MKTHPPAGSPAGLHVELPAGDLRRILTGLAKAAPARGNPHPAAGCVRISHDGSGSAEFAATDFRCWNLVRPPRSASGTPGAAALVPVAALRDALKGLPAARVVRIRSEGAGLVLAQAEETRTLPVHRTDGFPEPPPFTGAPATLPPSAKRAISEALRCASTDETRAVLQGVAFDLTDPKCHHIVGTDGRHLYSANSFALPVPGSRILGSSPLLLWEPFARADAWRLRTRVDPKSGEGAWEITSGIWRAVGPIVDGPYPRWRQVVPEKGAFKHRAAVAPADCPDLAERLLRLPLSSSTADRHESLLIEGDGHGLHIRWRDAADGEIRSTAVRTVALTRSPFRIAVPRPQFAKAIGFGLGEMQLIDEMGPLRLSDGKGRQMIIMPLRNAFPEAAANPSNRDRPAAGIPAREIGPAPKEPETPKAAAPPPAQPRPTPTRTPKPASPAPPPVTGTPKAPEPAHPPESGTADSPSLDAAMRELAGVRDSLRQAASGLQTAAVLVRQARQEQRSADREMRSVRSRLRGLTGLTGLRF